MVGAVGRTAGTAAALGTIRKESGSWTWMVFTAAFQLAVAWVVTFLVYQVGMLIL